MPRPPPDSPDQTLTQAAHILAKASRKRAPVPPKRTSSFKDTQIHGSASPSIPPLPETLIEMENNPDFYSSEHTPEELDALDSVDKEFQFLNENNKMLSSSDEKLSTPASQSRSGSLDRVRDRIGFVDNSPRSSSRERSLDDLEQSSPGKSGSPLKTPDTDLSDSSAALPPPPPEVVFPPPPPPEELELELEPIQSPPSPKSAKKQQQIRQQVFPKGPVPMLRSSLRKTKPTSEFQKREKEDGVQSESGDYKHPKTIGSLEESNVKQVISQYGTIPKGARIGAFLASLEQNNQDKDSSVVAKLQSPSNDRSPTDKFVHKEGSRSLQPTPEVTRKVEEWRIGVELSMNIEKNDTDEEHNVKPSSIFRSSSIHAMPGSEDNNDTGLGGSLKRQKSDLTKPNKDDRSRRNSDNRLLLQNMGIKENMDAPIPEWKRQIQKPTFSPRAVQRSIKQVRPELKEQTSLDQTTGCKDNVKSAPPMLRPFQRKPSSSADDAQVESKTLDKNINTENTEYASRDSLARKFSPPVPKKPVLQSSVDGKKDGMGGEMTKSTDSSQDGSVDAVIDTIPVGKLNKSLWERDKEDTTDNKNRDKERLSKKDKKQDKRDKKGTKPTSPSPVEKEKGKSKFPFLRSSQESSTKGQNYSPSRDPSKPVGKHLPPGAQPVLPGAGLPGARQVLPGGPMLPVQKPSVSSVTPCSSSQPVLKVQSTSVQLNKIDKPDKESKNDSESRPISKEKLQTLSKNLTSSLASLNLNKTKHTSNFMHLSEEVQSFYTACSSYVESLPPHGKFQFRELLTNLQAVAESLKTCSGGNAREYDKLLSRLQNSIRDINTVLAR